MKSFLATILFVFSLLAQSQYHVVTDQSFYFSGDEMYINVLKESSTSEVVSIYLCSGEFELVGKNIQLNNGIGAVKLQLPKKIKSGVYQVQIANQQGYVGAIPVRINARSDDYPLKNANGRGELLEGLISVDLDDTLFTASKASATITTNNDSELSTMNISITNRNPRQYQLSSTNQATGEMDGIAVKGYIKDLDGNKLSNHSFMMVVPMANDFYTGQSNEDGYFELDIDVYLPVFDAVFLSLSPQIHHKIQIELITYSCQKNENDVNGEAVSAKRALANTVINDAFKPLEFSDSYGYETSNYSQFYDRQVRPAEYTSSTMFQVFNDIVPKVHVRKNTFGMYALESTTKLKVPPLIFINGIPTYDYDYVLNMAVDQVELIGVIASFRTLRTYFQAGNGGIIEINTVDKSIIPSRSKNIARLRGIDEPITEEAKVSSEDVSFKSLLLFKPQVELKNGESKSIDFETSLESGRYYFNVSGVTSDGGVFHQSIPFFIDQEAQ